MDLEKLNRSFYAKIGEKIQIFSKIFLFDDSKKRNLYLQMECYKNILGASNFFENQILIISPTYSPSRPRIQIFGPLI